jgi:hypothetical protein
MAAIAMVPIYLPHADPETRNKIFGRILSQAVGRLDKVSHVAADCLSASFPEHFGPDDDPFIVADKFIVLAINELVYTAGAPIESVNVLAACSVLKSMLNWSRNSLIALAQ